MLKLPLLVRFEDDCRVSVVVARFPLLVRFEDEAWVSVVAVRFSPAFSMAEVDAPDTLTKLTV